ncbi:MAG: inositol monophosphatase [Rhodospirillales bacterium]|nr:inositol monophosphatase [Rhodospirillales bacterium]
MQLPDRDTVTQIIRTVAADEIMARFRNLGEADIREKNPGDWVTVADLESEKRLTAAFLELLPESAVVGEEVAEDNPSILKALTGPGPVWIIDPVDGTQNFSKGKDCFAVIVAYLLNGQIRAGWIHDPVSGRTVWAAAGEGAWATDGTGDWTCITASAPKDFTAMAGSLPYRLRKTFAERQHRNQPPFPARVVRMGSVGREYMELAQGNLDFALYRFKLKPWDHAAGVLIAEEAGGFAGLAPGSPLSGLGLGIAEGSLLLAPSADNWRQLVHEFEL